MCVVVTLLRLMSVSNGEGEDDVEWRLIYFLYTSGVYKYRRVEVIANDQSNCSPLATVQHVTKDS